MGIVIALVMGVIGLVIVNDVLTNAAFAGLLGTITGHIATFFALSLLAIAAAVGYAKLR